MQRCLSMKEGSPVSNEWERLRVGGEKDLRYRERLGPKRLKEANRKTM